MEQSKEITKTQNPSAPANKLAAWQNALIKSESKFLAIADPVKTKIELGFAAQIFQKSEALQKTDPHSIMDAVINVARANITLNPVMKLAYLIPRDGKCVLDFSYIGLVKILTDGGLVKYIEAFIVYDDEQFNYDPLSGKLEHTPKYAETEEQNNKRKIKGAYSRAILKDGDVVFCFMPLWELEKIKKMSPGAASSFSPYKNWGLEMFKKSVIRRHYKLLPKGSLHDAIATAVELDNMNAAGQSPPPAPKSISEMFVDTDAEDVTDKKEKTTPAAVPPAAPEPPAAA